MTGRLPASVMVGALLRKAEAEGGFGAVLAKGDAMSGSIVVILAERGGKAGVFERILQPDGAYAWQRNSSQDTENIDQVPSFVASRRRFDPDLWVLELDIASAERFAAEMNSLD